MIELDTISDLVKNRNQVYETLPAVARFGFDEQYLYDGVTQIIPELINAPSFIVNETNLNQYSKTNNPPDMIAAGRFDVPFDSFSVVLTEYDLCSIYHITLQRKKYNGEDRDYLTSWNFIKKDKARWFVHDTCEFFYDKGELCWGFLGATKNATKDSIFKKMLATIKKPLPNRYNDTQSLLKIYADEVLATLNYLTHATTGTCKFKESNSVPITVAQVSKAKKPLWEYRLLNLSDVKTDFNTPPLGGTHASPRFHLRRGHWRTLKSGKQVFIKMAEVGDKSKGIIEKDYDLT